MNKISLLICILLCVGCRAEASDPAPETASGVVSALPGEEKESIEEENANELPENKERMKAVRSWRGLVPGVSTLEDVYETLGEPKIYDEGSRQGIKLDYEIDWPGAPLNRMNYDSIYLSQSTKKVKRIKVYSPDAFEFKNLKEVEEALGPPAKIRHGVFKAWNFRTDIGHAITPPDELSTMYYYPEKGVNYIETYHDGIGLLGNFLGWRRSSDGKITVAEGFQLAIVAKDIYEPMSLEEYEKKDRI